MQEEVVYYDWTPESMLEVSLPTPDSFLKVMETLTRMGIASKKENRLFQSAHILHKRGRYFIVHFKELFILDGKNSTLTKEDIEIRNAIAALLDEWGLVQILAPISGNSKAALAHIKVLSYREKQDWELVPKYTIGQRRN